MSRLQWLKKKSRRDLPTIHNIHTWLRSYGCWLAGVGTSTLGSLFFFLFLFFNFLLIFCLGFFFIVIFVFLEIFDFCFFEHEGTKPI